MSVMECGYGVAAVSRTASTRLLMIPLRGDPAENNESKRAYPGGHFARHAHIRTWTHLVAVMVTGCCGRRSGVFKAPTKGVTPPRLFTITAGPVHDVEECKQRECRQQELGN
ncbi:hypothetical protein V8C43DRAFT_271866 [Trichoderma afarasin]